MSDNKQIDQHFLNIIMVFATSCWQHLGKIPNQMTGKTEKDMMQAQIAIEILDMLSRKTKGNLSADEEKLLLNTLTDLQLNYADEANKIAKEVPQKPKEEVKEQPKPEEKKV
jgi:hypothetical protein